MSGGCGSTARVLTLWSVVRHNVLLRGKWAQTRANTSMGNACSIPALRCGGTTGADSVAEDALIAVVHDDDGETGATINSGCTSNGNELEGVREREDTNR